MYVRWIKFMKMLWEELGFTNSDEIFLDEQTGNELMVMMLQSGMLQGGGFGLAGSPAGASNAPSEGRSGNAQSQSGQPSGQAGFEQALMGLRGGGPGGAAGQSSVAVEGRI
jgi:hypothetical protein